MTQIPDYWVNSNYIVCIDGMIKFSLWEEFNPVDNDECNLYVHNT